MSSLIRGPPGHVHTSMHAITEQHDMPLCKISAGPRSFLSYYMPSLPAETVSRAATAAFVSGRPRRRTTPSKALTIYTNPGYTNFKHHSFVFCS